MADAADIARAAAETAARQSYGKLVAFLAARIRDVAGAEDALADAFAAALERWPVEGVPVRPEAWLLTVARRRGIDQVRRRQTGIATEDHLRLMTEEIKARETAEELPDERLRLMFACAHPAIEAGMRAPLMLQAILGLNAATIAVAFLVPPATMGQRLVRAKNRIRQTGIPFRVPERVELDERLDAVLEAIYAAYAEGWSDPTGSEGYRRGLAAEGIWLGRLVMSLMPEEPEALGLLALMLFAESRRAARRNTAGDFVPLAEQDMALWDAGMIAEAEALLHRAAQMGKVGRYQLEAAIQSAHAARQRLGATDWTAIAGLYETLASFTRSPVVAVNHAVAIAMAGRAEEALRRLDAAADDKRLAEYQPYWAARAEVQQRLGDRTAASSAYEKAIGLEADPAVRHFLEAKLAALTIGE
jgi:RNA polymerase sigma-70 factor (ECF subfamily)